VCTKQNNGFTAVQNTVQKIMAFLNWLNFVSEVYFEEPARVNALEEMLAPMGGEKVDG